MRAQLSERGSEVSPTKVKHVDHDGGQTCKLDPKSLLQYNGEQTRKRSGRSRREHGLAAGGGHFIHGVLHLHVRPFHGIHHNVEDPVHAMRQGRERDAS